MKERRKARREVGIDREQGESKTREREKSERVTLVSYFCSQRRFRVVDEFLSALCALSLFSNFKIRAK